jgi:hypothetical protein
MPRPSAAFSATPEALRTPARSTTTCPQPRALHSRQSCQRATIPRPTKRRKVSALGERKGHARDGKNVRAEISVNRNQRSHRDQRCPAASHHDASDIRERTIAVTGVGQQADHEPLNQNINHGAYGQGSEQAKSGVPARILGLAHRHQRGFKAAISKHEQYQGMRPGMCVGRYLFYRNSAVSDQLDCTDHAHQAQR